MRGASSDDFVDMGRALGVCRVAPPRSMLCRLDEEGPDLCNMGGLWPRGLYCDRRRPLTAEVSESVGDESPLAVRGEDLVGVRA